MRRDRDDLRESLGSVRVGLRTDLEFSRQVMRGEGRYVVHDPLTFKNHVFDRQQYRILAAIVPTRTLAQIYRSLVASGDLERTREDEREFYEFVLWLNGQSIVRLPVRDAAALHRRRATARRLRRPGLVQRLVYWRISLVDPDRFLDRTLPWFGWAFSRVGLAVWCALIAFACFKCFGRFGEMFAETTTLLSFANIPILYVALVVLKVVHEFGHAYACKRFGCSVPEMGIVFIFGAPCAYVDASASWKLSNRWRRIAIGMGGMYVESTVAALAALVWAGTQPGLVHDIAVNVIVLASLVTVLFNINPLMRFDGYYVFTDLVSTPNLYERSRQFIAQRAKRLFLGIPFRREQLIARERFLYGIYGFAAMLYKVFLAFAIVSMVFLEWPIVGTALGLAFGYALIVQPVARLMRYLLYHQETVPVRNHARLIALVAMPTVALLLASTPVSWRVVAPAVLEPERATVLRAPADGFVAHIAARDGADLAAGDLMAHLDNPELQLQIERAERLLQAERLRLEAAELTDPAAIPVHDVKLKQLAANLARLQERAAAMRLESPVAGAVAARHVEAGSYVRTGDAVAEIHGGPALVRLVLTDEEYERTGIAVGEEVQLRWSVDPANTVVGRVRQVLPSASRKDVPTELTVLGGGEIYGTADGNDVSGLRASRAYLHVLIEPAEVPLERTAGLTARVHLPARMETVGTWLWRGLAGFYNSWRMS